MLFLGFEHQSALRLLV